MSPRRSSAAPTPDRSIATQRDMPLYPHRGKSSSGSIPLEELFPALLSEDAATAAAFRDLIDHSQRTDARQRAAQVVKDAEKKGLDIIWIKEQLYAPGWPRPAA
jgi:hypothetical protein